MYIFWGLLFGSLLSGAISVGCASADHTVRPEAMRYATATLSLVDRETGGRVKNTPETSDRALNAPLNVIREIIVFPLRVVTTLLIVTGDWLEYERDAGKARRDPYSNLTARHCG
jgi:hypothetical protein